MTDLPVVSAIVPARHEELNIATAVSSLARQPELREIIVVDDQSQDHTPEILAKLQKECAILRVRRIDDLPQGWTGKAHAAAEGAKLASGAWLLFTDADTVHYFGSLAALLARAEIEHADLLSISPGQRAETWWEKAVIPLVYIQLSRLYRFEDVSDPASPAAAANGQYILIRRSIYDRIGGHAAVRAAILEDVELARRVKSAGGKLLFLPGAEWAKTRMYRTFGEMWRGWTKNLFLLYGGSASRIIRAVAELMFIEWFPRLLMIPVLLYFLLNPSPAWIRILIILCAALLLWRGWNYSRQLKRLGFPSRFAEFIWAGAPLLSALLLNSLWAYRRGGSIQWKGRSYPAKEAR
ncbi:MAG: glycosyltransferase [Terriglobia bacterium]